MTIIYTVETKDQAELKDIITALTKAKVKPLIYTRKGMVYTLKFSSDWVA